MGKHMARVVVLISADAEWRAVRTLYPHLLPEPSPLGEWLSLPLEIRGEPETAILFHGGWGKIAAAASTQYVLDRWKPSLLVNLGTCGGFKGHVARGTIILAERTLVYDIVEQMGDGAAAIAHYATALDLSWLKEPYPHPVLRTLLVSGDRDLAAEEVERLHTLYGAVAGDWESGAIAYVAARNGARCLILRGVTDLVGPGGGEAYGQLAFFQQAAQEIMARLLDALPAWVEKSL